MLINILLITDVVVTEGFQRVLMPMVRCGELAQESTGDSDEEAEFEDTLDDQNEMTK